LGLKWEFAGGKANINKPYEYALIRKIKEELNISIFVDNKITEESYNDEVVNIILHYYFCTTIDGVISLNEHEKFNMGIKK